MRGGAVLSYSLDHLVASGSFLDTESTGKIAGAAINAPQNPRNATSALW